jgi:hypothetical protein
LCDLNAVRVGNRDGQRTAHSPDYYMHKYT